MSEVKLTEAQIGALQWANGMFGRHWQGVKFGSPPRATVNAMLRRGLMKRVGHVSMDLFITTDLGRSTLAREQGGRRDGEG